MKSLFFISLFFILSISYGKNHIKGIVLDSTIDFPSVFNKFDETEPKSPNEWLAVFKQLPKPIPAPNVEVHLKGGRISKRTTTDAKGTFSFINLPYGEYEITAKSANRPATNKGKRTAIAKKWVRTKGGGKVRHTTLFLNNLYATITGTVVDKKGQPIAKAKITATERATSPFYNRPEDYVCKKWITYSKADGSFEFKHVILGANYFHLMGAIAGNKIPRDVLYLKVEALGFSQQKEQPVIVATKEHLYLARKLLKTYNDMLERDHQQFLREHDKLPLHKSSGNTITGITIELDKVD